jgi:hypothetical protein
MKLSVISLLIILVALGCKNPKDTEKVSSGEVEQNTLIESPTEIQKYKNDTWNFAFEYSEDLIVSEGKLPGNSAVINVYPEKMNISKPLAIHEKPEIPYIAFLPNGFGVDAPSGSKKSLKEYKANLNLSFNMNEIESQVYLLENGEPWAYFLRFNQPPEKWNKYGGVFVHYAVSNFKASCVSSMGESKPMQECDPMGEDKVSFSGKVEEKSKNKLDKVLESLYFTREDSEKRKDFSDLIKVEKPLPNIEITSPLEIKGKASGSWFFEAEAPVKLVDKDYKVLAETSIKAEGEWMTNDFVQFSGKINFKNAPEDERGYLIFEKSNASGKPELDRKYTLPVLFPPK